MDVFIGFIAALPYNFAPKDWVRCNGQALPISQNASLNALLGGAFGSTATTFNVPDLRGRTIVGATLNNQAPGMTGNYKQGQNGGSEFVTLNINQMPKHNHNAVVANTSLPVTGTISASLNVGTAIGNTGAAGNYLASATSNSGGFGSEQIYTTAGGAVLNRGAVVATSNLSAQLNNAAVTVAQNGGSQSHENRMPYLAIQYCIATNGIYPTQP